MQNCHRAMPAIVFLFAGMARSYIEKRFIIIASTFC